MSPLDHVLGAPKQICSESQLWCLKDSHGGVLGLCRSAVGNLGSRLSRCAHDLPAAREAGVHGLGRVSHVGVLVTVGHSLWTAPEDESEFSLCVGFVKHVPIGNAD